jgi:methyl-accepting chemotaxis protein
MLLLGIGFGLGVSNWMIRDLTRSFSERIRNLIDEAQQVGGAATQIHSTSQRLSESTTEQAAAIEETVSSMEEMTSMLTQTTQQASQSLDFSESGHQEAEKSKEVIARLASAMDEIQASNSKLEGIVRLIEEIRNKTKVINDIVFETRLLSFNASIEAARAGAHGKGFAVVAEEVGKLALMSGKAADEIRNLLDSSTQEVAKVVKGTQERVQVGKTVSQECEVAFLRMGESLQKIAESVRLIAAATREQEVGVKQTNKAMSEMDQATQSNSKSSEGLANEASRLAEGAKILNDTIRAIEAMVTEEVRPVKNQDAQVIPLSRLKSA